MWDEGEVITVTKSLPVASPLGSGQPKAFPWGKVAAEPQGEDDG